jgi:hypothetical protein
MLRLAELMSEIVSSASPERLVESAALTTHGHAALGGAEWTLRGHGPGQTRLAGATPPCRDGRLPWR